MQVQLLLSSNKRRYFSYTGGIAENRQMDLKHEH